MIKVKNEDLDDFMKVMRKTCGDGWPTQAAKLAIIWYDKAERLQEKLDKLEAELDLEKRKHAGGLNE